MKTKIVGDTLSFIEEINDSHSGFVIEALRKNSSIKKLDLSMNNIGDNGIREISEFLKYDKNIVELDLGYNPVSDEGAGHLMTMLETNSTINKINLTLTGILVENREAISSKIKNNILKKDPNNLFLDGNYLTGEELKKVVASIKGGAIKHVFLEDKYIADESFKDITEALESNKTITKIDLGNSKIGYIGARHMIDMLRKNTTIEEVITDANQYMSQEHKDDIKYLISSHVFDNEVAKQFKVQEASKLSNVGMSHVGGGKSLTR